MKYFLSLAVAAALLPQEKADRNWTGRKPPELELALEAWLNVRESPTLAAFKGRVIWLELLYIN